MPAFADMTVKKADGTTDVVYAGLTPSSGDSTAAQWRVESGFTVASHKPRLEVKTRYNANRTGRRLDAHYVYPITQVDAASGLTTVIGGIPLSVTGLIPLDVSDTVVAEAVAQWANLMDHALFASMLKSGYAAT